MVTAHDYVIYLIYLEIKFGPFANDTATSTFWSDM